jgi:nucleotide-binding universal stress UspA family protein
MMAMAAKGADAPHAAQEETMFRNILVPLDGSDRAERVLPIAAQIAKARGATVTLLRVVPDIADVGGYMIPAVVNDYDISQREELEASNYLNDIAKNHALQGTTVNTLVEFGAPTRVILDAIRTTGVDGVIIGSHGRTGLSRWMLGSVAQAIVRHSSSPVLLVRQQGPTLDDGLRQRPFRVLVPLDGSELAEAALEPAQLLGDVFAPDGAYELHLVRVIPFLNTAAPDDLRDTARAESAAALECIAKRISAASEGRALVTASVILEIDAASAIARLTRADELVTGSQISSGCDLIAMATHGRTGLARLAIGSVTERVLGATVAPALIIRPEAMKVEGQLARAGAAEATTSQQTWPALH